MQQLKQRVMKSPLPVLSFTCEFHLNKTITTLKTFWNKSLLPLIFQLFSYPT